MRKTKIGAALSLLAGSAALATATASYAATPRTLPQDADGCNRDVCIQVFGNADRGWQITATSNTSFHGHLRITGPGGLDRDGATGDGPPALTVGGTGAGHACAYGYRHNTGGGTTLMGNPCVWIS